MNANSLTSNLSWQNLSAYKALMRTDKPVGTYLLLWPTYWALFLAAEGVPDVTTFIIFSLGVFVMRSAGCVINDYADRKIDGSVKRTKERPLASGAATAREALQLFTILIAVAFILVLFLGLPTIILSFVGLGLAISYPFMKRYTHFPQVVLGAAFSWSIPMVFMATVNELPYVVWLIYGANLLWTVAYDTIYAMVDRDDDLKIGVKSTAIFFGQLDRIMILFLQIVVLFLLWIVGEAKALSAVYFVSLFIASALVLFQQWQIRTRERDACFMAFRQSHYFGLVILAGIAGHYLMI